MDFSYGEFSFKAHWYAASVGAYPCFHIVGGLAFPVGCERKTDVVAPAYFIAYFKVYFSEVAYFQLFFLFAGENVDGFTLPVFPFFEWQMAHEIERCQHVDCCAECFQRTLFVDFKFIFLVHLTYAVG